LVIGIKQFVKPSDVLKLEARERRKKAAGRRSRGSDVASPLDYEPSHGRTRRRYLGWLMWLLVIAVLIAIGYVGFSGDPATISTPP
jgi:hypothetical protein